MADHRNDRQHNDPPPATFILLHGAGSDSWYWHLVAPRLVQAGDDVLAVDFPVDDDTCGLADYAAAALEQIGFRTGLTLVAQPAARTSAA
ncbi:MAG: hypothetical protein ACYDAQ_00290 [Mycobacteriales bacterium]